MKITTATVLAALCAIHPLSAFEVTVSGLYFPTGVTPPTYTLKSLGGDSTPSTSANSYAEWIQVPPFDNEYGDPVENWEIVSGSERTVFSFSLTGDWAGRQVSLARAGGQTNFVHFYFGGLGFNASDFSGNPPAQAPSVTMLGNYFTIGRLINGVTEEYPPYVTSTSTQGDPAWPDTTIDFIATRSRSLWRWSNLVSASDPRMETAMTLNADHALKLFKHGSQDGITLDPIAGTIKIGVQPVLTTNTAAAQFVGKTTKGVNLALSGGIIRAQAGLPPQLVLGNLNDNEIDFDGIDHTQGVLIVGTGTPASGGTPADRKNGLRILDDGTVLIMPKGDLNMGTFDDGPRP